MWVQFTKKEDGRWFGKALNPSMNTGKSWNVPFQQIISSESFKLLSSKFIFPTEQSIKNFLDHVSWDEGLVWCDHVRDTNPNDPCKGVHIVRIKSLPFLSPMSVTELKYQSRSCFAPDFTTYSGDWVFHSPGAVPFLAPCMDYRDQTAGLKKHFWHKFKEVFEWTYQCKIKPLTLGFLLGNSDFSVFSKEVLLSFFGIPAEKFAGLQYDVDVSFSIDSNQSSYLLRITFEEGELSSRDETRLLFFFKNPLLEYVCSDHDGTPIVKNLPLKAGESVPYTDTEFECEHEFQKSLLALLQAKLKTFSFHGKDYIHQIGGAA